MQSALFSFTNTMRPFPSVLLLARGRYQSGPVSKEPHQPFQILCNRRQVKLSAYELDPSAPLLLLWHRPEVFEELPLRHGASERAVHCGVGHVAVSHAGDDDFAFNMLAPPVAVDGDGDGLKH